MSTQFDAFGQVVREQVSAVVEAELLTNPARTERYRAVLRQGRVRPRLIACQPTFPARDPSPAPLRPMWLVFEAPPVRGERAFIALDLEHARFGLGRWEGHTAWFLGGEGGLLDLVEQLVAEAA